MKVRQTLRGIAMSIVLAAGLIALMQAESDPQPESAWRKIKQPKQHAWRKIFKPGPLSRSEKVAGDLKNAMSADELAGLNPYETLSSEDALRRLLERPILTFERKTLRSPSYRDEAGYDVVHYDIQHTDGSQSSILAFVDHTGELVTTDNVEIRGEETVIMVLTPKDGGEQEYALYRNGALEELTTVPPEESASLVAQRLDAAIPFLSVSR